MNAIVFGMAMLVSSTAVSPALETPRATAVPAAVSFTFDLPDGAGSSRNLPLRLLAEQTRPAWGGASFQAAPATAPKRFNKTDRIIAVVASACGGWLVGGAIGFAATSTGRRDDDVSGLRGMVIGAPLGAALSAIVAYRLTK